MREQIVSQDFMHSTDALNSTFTVSNSAIAPFFSMRKLRLIYNELSDTAEFEYSNFDEFKHQVLNSVAPQLELNKWQAIAARR